MTLSCFIKDLKLLTGDELSNCISEFSSLESNLGTKWGNMRGGYPVRKALCKLQSAGKILEMVNKRRMLDGPKLNLFAFPIIFSLLCQPSNYSSFFLWSLMFLV